MLIMLCLWLKVLPEDFVSFLWNSLSHLFCAANEFWISDDLTDRPEVLVGADKLVVILGGNQGHELKLKCNSEFNFRNYNLRLVILIIGGNRSS